MVQCDTRWRPKRYTMSPDITKHLCETLEEMRTNRNELVALVQELIRAHPIYDSPGIALAQQIAAREMELAGLDVSWVPFDFDQMQQSPQYVDVKAFGGVFCHYGQADRYSVHGRLTLGEEGPLVVLNGHLDVEFVTEPDQWSIPGLWASGLVEFGKIYGRGASDMLGGVACMLFTLKRLKDRLGKRGSIEVHLVVDEEVGGNGTLWSLLNAKEKASVAIIPEPTNRVVCTDTRGFYQFRILCHGRSGHMVFADAYDNAIRVAADVVSCLEDLNTWVGDACSRPKSRYIMCGEMTGGSDSAIPAVMAELKVTAILPLTISLDTVLDQLQHILKMRLLGRCAQIPTIAPYGICFPGSTLSDWALCETIVQNGSSIGQQLGIGSFPSPCDGRHFEAFGIPCVIFGPGDLKRAHGADEYVTIAELEEYSYTLAATLLNLFPP